MAQVFGLDFGTTNSLVAVVQNERAISLVNREDSLPHPSVVWYRGTDITVGRAAKAHLSEATTGVVGDAVRSPKAFLGSGSPIYVAGVARHAADVVADVLRFIRKDALDRKLKGEIFDRAVVTIPVGMSGRARRELRDAALKSGIHIVQFVHEPLAALYGYIRSQPDYLRLLAELEGQVALVFDWGGGTLDLTVCQFLGQTLVQILNNGDNQVGGDRFDEAIREYIRRKHTEAHHLTSSARRTPRCPGSSS